MLPPPLKRLSIQSSTHYYQKYVGPNYFGLRIRIYNFNLFNLNHIHLVLKNKTKIVYFRSLALLEKYIKYLDVYYSF